jgi:hypothetical protein
MIEDLPIELIAEEDHVLAITRQKLFIRVSGIPDSGFRHEVEPSAVDDRRTFELVVGTEEDGSSEDSLE